MQAPHAELRYWVETCLDANWITHTTGGEQRGPFLSARAIGMTLMAMQDAYAQASGGTPYLTGLPTVPAAKPLDAAAAAAMTVLQRLYPSMMVAGGFLDSRCRDYALRYPMAPQGTALGVAVAEAHIAARAGDAAHMVELPYAPEGRPYDHDLDPNDPDQRFLGTQWGNAPFFLPGQILHTLAPPPGACIPEKPLPFGAPNPYDPDAYYATEFEEVKSLGALDSTTRTADQTEIGIFWGYDGPSGLGTPPRLYMQVAIAVLDQRPKPLSDADWLHCLSAVAVAMADSGIQAWHYKWSPIHMLWRPVLGIRCAPEGGGNLADQDWTPLGKPLTNKPPKAGSPTAGQTPDFPAYPSGHATFGAAAFEVLRRFIRKAEHLHFGNGDIDPIAFDFVSDEYDGRNKDGQTGQPRPRRLRRYDSLWQAIVDNSESRIWLGVHWRMDGISRKLPDESVVSARPGKPAELGDFGGCVLGCRIAVAVAAARGFA